MLFVNFKTYKESTGENAIKLAKACENIAKKTGKKIIPVVQAIDLKAVVKAVDIPVFTQHVDEVEYGSNTGHILIDVAKQAGAKGTILNHSENRIPMSKIKETIKKCKEKNFTILVCAQDPKEVQEISKLNPDYVAYEPPELIGGNISVSTAKPELIQESVKKAGKIPLIVGAGVKNKQDVITSIKLGSKGILVASGVVKSTDIEKAIEELVN